MPDTFRRVAPFRSNPTHRPASTRLWVNGFTLEHLWFGMNLCSQVRLSMPGKTKVGYRLSRIARCLLLFLLAHLSEKGLPDVQYYSFSRASRFTRAELETAG